MAIKYIIVLFVETPRKFITAKLSIRKPGSSSVLIICDLFNSHALFIYKRCGVYRIPCECGVVYIGETGRNLSVRLKEHKMNCEKAEQDKSAVAKHTWTYDHRKKWDEATILAIDSHKFSRKMRESIEIEKHNTIDQEGKPLDSTWRALFNVQN